MVATLSVKRIVCLTVPSVAKCHILCFLIFGVVSVRTSYFFFMSSFQSSYLSTPAAFESNFRIDRPTNAYETQ